MKHKRIIRLTNVLVVALLLSGLCAAAAQAQGPTPTANWRGYIVDQQNKGGYFGGIVVRAAGKGGLLAQVESEGGLNMQGSIGSAPAYGADACEFAGVKPDLYYLSLPSLGASIQVKVPEGEIVIVEFAPESAAVPATKLSMVRAFNYGPDPVTLTINNQEYEVPSQSYQIITLHPGNYFYSVSSPGYDTLNDQATFKAGYWTWTISQESHEAIVREISEADLPSGEAIGGSGYRAGATTHVPAPTTLPVTGAETGQNADFSLPASLGRFWRGVLVNAWLTHSKDFQE